MFRTFVASTAIVLLLSSGLLAAPAAAHAGNNCGLSGAGAALRLEGECYTSAVGGPYPCEPDYDGEHIQVSSRYAASGGAVAFLPYYRCSVEFSSVNFAPVSPLPGVSYSFKITGLVYACSGFSGGMWMPLYIAVDGRWHSAYDASCFASDGFQSIPTDISVSRGTHRIEVAHWGWPDAANVEFDYLSISCKATIAGVVPLSC